jgi:hypothetical protein
MFGVVSFLPLFLQIANGVSATYSGLLLLPLMLGLLCASILSGQLITRTGRYKVYPVLGTAIATLGMLLLSRMNEHTPRALSTAYMAITGVGIGLVMQVMVVATQNSVARAYLGVATSTLSFFRSVGGSFGVALFGAVFNARLRAELARALPETSIAALHSASGARGFRSIQSLPPSIREEYAASFARALGTTFLYAVPCFAVAFGLVLFLKEQPLRGRTDAMAAGHSPEEAAR